MKTASLWKRKIYLGLIFFLALTLKLFAQLTATESANHTTIRIDENSSQASSASILEFPGCPLNSVCSAAMGKKFQNWANFLKGPNGLSKESWEGTAKKIEQYRLAFGIPISVWAKPPSSKDGQNANPNMITWDSHCPHHQNGPDKLLVGKIFTPNLREVKSADIIMGSAYLLKGNKVITYQIPRSETPVFIDGEDLIHVHEDEGIYYQVRISPKGDLAVVNHKIRGPLPKEVPCPPELNKYFQAKVADKNIYLGSYCKEIWNGKSQSAQTMLFNWSCN